MPTKRILVTGVSRDLGSRVARALAADDDHLVVGVDVTPPRHDLGRCSFVRADIRNPVIAKVIAAYAVDTVVHMAIVASPLRGGRPLVDEGDQRHRHHAAAGRVPAGGDVRQAGGAELGLGVRRVAAGPGQVHRGPAAPGGPAHRVRQGLGGGRVLRPGAGPAPARRGGDHPAAGQPDGGRGGQQRHPLPVAARGAAGARLRCPAAVPASQRRRRGPAAGHPGRHPRHLQRGGPGHRHAVPGAGHAGPAQRRHPALGGAGRRGRVPPGPAERLLGRPDRRADLRSGHGHHPVHRGRRFHPGVQQPVGAGGVRGQCATGTDHPGAGRRGAGAAQPGSSRSPRRARRPAVAEAEVIQLGSRGPAGRGSRTSPSAAARGLAAEAAPTRTPRVRPP